MSVVFAHPRVLRSFEQTMMSVYMHKRLHTVASKSDVSCDGFFAEGFFSHPSLGYRDKIFLLLPRMYNSNQCVVSFNRKYGLYLVKVFLWFVVYVVAMNISFACK